MVISQSSTSLLDPVLASLSPEDAQVLDDIIAKAPSATTFTTIFKAYSEVLREKGLDPGEDVVYYKRLLKLGVIKGADWGTKWKTVKAQLPFVDNSSIRTRNSQKEFPSTSSSPFENDDVFLSTKIDEDTVTPISSNNLSFSGFKKPNLRRLKHPTRHKPKATSDTESSVFPVDGPQQTNRPFSGRSNPLNSSRVQSPVKHISGPPKGVHPVNEKEAWKKVEETRLAREADYFRRQSLLSASFHTWRRGLEWIYVSFFDSDSYISRAIDIRQTTHHQIDEARTSIQLQIHFSRWKNRLLTHRLQIQEVETTREKRILYIMLQHWYKSLSKRRIRKFNRELNSKLCDFQGKCQQRIYRDAWRVRSYHSVRRFI